MKDAFYFPHDSNASQDPKILQMCSVYGAQGYGWFWMLIEMMRDQQGYRLDMSGKYALHSLSIRMYTNKDTLVAFLYDCVHEFKLFQQDDTYMWSESLYRRMASKDEKSQKARESVLHRWRKNVDNPPADTNVSKTDTPDNTNVPKNDTKDKKRKGEKRKELKETNTPMRDADQPVDNVDKSPPDKNDQLPDDNPDFMTFWRAYPKRVGMSKALIEWGKLTDQGVEERHVILAAKKYADHVEKEGIIDQYVKMPHNFLTDGAYFEFMPMKLPDCPDCGGTGLRAIIDGDDIRPDPCNCRDLRYGKREKVS